jgi:hypothetical protein
MSGSFGEQFQLVEPVFRQTLGIGRQLTICTGSGISHRRMPMLSRLIARAFCPSPPPQDLEARFNHYSGQYMFAARVKRKIGNEVPDPLPLSVFRTLDPDVQDDVCSPLCQIYGDVFHDLENVYGDRQPLLEALQFEEFQRGSPDAAHCYVAFLVAEGVIREVVTFNWDRLVEVAIESSIPTPIQEIASVINTRVGWRGRRDGPSVIIAKLHGCASQFPGQLTEIVLTRQDLINASLPGSWQVEAMQTLFNNVVLICGFSGSDYDACIGIRKIVLDRRADNLSAPTYYIAQPFAVEGVTRDLIEGDEARHIPLDANDLFATIYFAWIKSRLLGAVEHGRALQACQRPFAWSEGEWRGALDHAEAFLNNDFPNILDRLIGAPKTRWETDAALLPIGLSHVRELFLRGEIRSKGKYTNLDFQPEKDLTLVLLVAAIYDLLGNKPHISFQLSHSYWGVDILNSQSGSRFQLIPYYGQYPQSAYGAMKTYLRQLQQYDNDLPSPKIVILPCNFYLQRAVEKLPPGPILGSKFPGDKKPIEQFIPPQRVFATGSFTELLNAIKEELDG